MRRAAWLAIAIAVPAYGAAPQKPFVDCAPEELVRAVPELAGLQFDSNQDRLSGLLRVAGENLGSMLAKLVDFSAAEDINELRFEENMTVEARREAFRYVVKPILGRPGVFEELRVDAATKTPAPQSTEFLVLSYFYKLLNYLLPQNQEQSRFRYLGRWDAGAQHTFVIAFAQRPGGTIESHIVVGSNGETAGMQGLVWIDAATSEIVRLRLDLLGPVERIPFETVTTDISLAAVDFKSLGRALLLPGRVTVHAKFAAGELHSVHRYSDYEADSAKGAAAASGSGDDSYELLAKGIALLQSGNSEDAIAELRKALSLNPALPAARYNLASALLASVDLAGAETELREALKLVPESVQVHNLLGIVLGKRGDVAGAVAELRTSVKILPKEPAVHFNLGQALERSGDRAAALAEYRTASELAPDNAVFKARYEQLERAPGASSMPETTIKVDVRQVLVPVIVTDKDGHHVAGLTREDFRVFEDGVEQKISAFSVEDSGLTDSVVAGVDATPRPAIERTASAPSAPRKPATIRQTYLICIDSLHSAASNLMSFRPALLKLFQSERSEDSQYILVALGTSIQVLQDTTSDRDKILQAIDSKQFLKVFNDSRKTEGNSDVVAFRRKLEEVRAACDHKDPACSEKPSLPAQARQLASEDRVYNQTFLNQFQALVQQFSRAPGRRTIVLISDGFQLVPGKQALDLLVAYFPEFRSAALEGLDRMQDLDPVLRAAANSNIPIYTIDSRGLYTSPYFDASNPGSISSMPAVMTIVDTSAAADLDTLIEIAAATGGTAFRNSNNILEGLQRAFADARQYYMLAYVPTNAATDGKFRAISVRVRDGKVSVKAKRGYWASAN
jgi:VWFA-related protein